MICIFAMSIFSLFQSDYFSIFVFCSYIIYRVIHLKCNLEYQNISSYTFSYQFRIVIYILKPDFSPAKAKICAIETHFRSTSVVPFKIVNEFFDYPIRTFLSAFIRKLK